MSWTCTLLTMHNKTNSAPTSISTSNTPPWDWGWTIQTKTYAKNKFNFNLQATGPLRIKMTSWNSELKEFVDLENSSLKKTLCNTRTRILPFNFDGFCWNFNFHLGGSFLQKATEHSSFSFSHYTIKKLKVNT